MLSTNGRRLVSSHEAALLSIVARPGCTVGEVAAGLGLTERSAWTAVSDLQRAGMVSVHRGGRRHLYTVDSNGFFELPCLGSFPVHSLSRGCRGSPTTRPTGCDLAKQPWKLRVAPHVAGHVQLIFRSDGTAFSRIPASSVVKRRILRATEQGRGPIRDGDFRCDRTGSSFDFFSFRVPPLSREAPALQLSITTSCFCV
jgi:hypothetical protein